MPAPADGAAASGRWDAGDTVAVTLRFAEPVPRSAGDGRGVRLMRIPAAEENGRGFVRRPGNPGRGLERSDKDE